MSTEQRKHVLELAERGDWPEALELVAQQPTLAQAQDDFGMLPLHWACTEPTVGLDVISALTRAFPGACALKNLSGMLPLHVAINARAPGLLMSALLDVAPQAALAKDARGRYPADLAVAKNLPSYTLDLIRKAGARAMRESAAPASASMSTSASASSLQQRSASMDDLTSEGSSSSSAGDTNQSANETADKMTALSKTQSIGSLMNSRQVSVYGRLLDDKLSSGSPLGPADSAEISLQLRELLSQLHQLSVDMRMNNTSSSGSTYRSSFSSAFSSAGGQRSGSGSDSLTSVLWNPSDKFGVVLEPANKETGARIKGFSSRSDVLGVEALGVGDVLANINGASVLGAKFTSIMRFLKHSKGTCKLRFSKGGGADLTAVGKYGAASNPATDHEAMLYSKVADMLEVTLKKVSAVEDTVRLSSAMSFCT